MNLRYSLLVLAFCVTGMVCAQRGGYGKKKVEKDRVAEYMDSLIASRQRIDSLVKPKINSCYSQLFIPLTFCGLLRGSVLLPILCRRLSTRL